MLFTKTKEKIKLIVSGGSKTEAEKILSAVSFAESSFFPIPPDILIFWLTIRFKNDWARIALISTLYSMAGGLFGYIIGFFLFDSVGQPIINFYNLNTEFSTIGDFFATYGFLALFIASFTPIPYKIFTLASGFFGMNLFIFFIASLIGRALRFFVVAYLTKILSARFKDKVLRYFNLITLVLGVLIFAILIYIFFIKIL